MVHNLNPILLQIYGDIAIRWYGLAYLAGFIVAFYLINWLTKRQHPDFKAEWVSDLVTYGAFGILIGGRLGYAVFYSPDLFFRFKAAFPFWGVLAVNEGGMASHGGMIGLVVACWLFARKYKQNLLYIFDLVAISGPVGIFFGRIANFINGELVGRPAAEGFRWGVKFPGDIEFWPNQAPDKIMALGDLIHLIPGFTREAWLQAWSQFSTQSVSRQYIYDGLRQIIIQIQSGQDQLAQALAPLLITRHPSQLYQALGEGLILFLLLFFIWAKPRKPGVIGALFLVFYAIARIVGEQFRMPDAHIGYQWLDLTRGQWLSIAMLAVGLVLLFIWTQQGAQAIPGWFRGRSIKVNRRYK